MKKSLLIAFMFLVLFAGVALAQGSDPNNPHNLMPEQQAQAKEIQMELWCPICQGVRLDVCEQKVCQQMRDMIDEMLVEGKSKQEIIDEFIDQYGVVILGEPPRQGINIMAWLMPILLVVAGLGFAFWMSKKWTQKKPSAVVADGTAPPDSTPSGTASTANDADDIDDYLARVERELGEDL